MSILNEKQFKCFRKSFKTFRKGWVGIVRVEDENYDRHGPFCCVTAVSLHFVTVICSYFAVSLQCRCILLLLVVPMFAVSLQCRCICVALIKEIQRKFKGNSKEIQKTPRYPTEPPQYALKRVACIFYRIFLIGKPLSCSVICTPNIFRCSHVLQIR